MQYINYYTEYAGVLYAISYFCVVLCNFRSLTMRWKLLLPFITRCEAPVSTHHISSLPHLHPSRLVTHVACIHYYHTSCCNLDIKLALVNNQSMIVSGCYLPLNFTYIWTRGYAKGMDRGRDKKTDKGITYVDGYICTNF
jgi:hypothetical protein